MGNIQNSLIEAMKIIADNSAANTRNAVTIEAQISDVIDAGVGLYAVRYGANTFTAYASNASLIYNINDIVYVLVSEGDFSKTKIIIGSIRPSSNLYVEDPINNKYIAASDNLLPDFVPIVASINSWEPTGEKIKDYADIKISNTKFNQLFQAYLENYNTFLLTVYVKTSLLREQQMNGNYGIKIRIPLINSLGESYWQEVVMDISNMLGSVYSFVDWQEQNLYFEIPEGSKLDLHDQENIETEIKIFKRDFKDSEEYTTDDIFFKGLSIKAVDVIPETELNGYYLSIIASEGIYFSSTSSSQKILTPVLKVSGRNTSLKDTNCYWFVEDYSINTTSEYYLSLGGLGWKCLNDRAINNGAETYDLITNRYTQIVNQEDILGEGLRFKCIIQKDDKTVSKIITIKNLSNTDKINVKLKTLTGATAYNKNIGTVNLQVLVKYIDKPITTELKYSFQRFDKNGNYIDDLLSNENNGSYIKYSTKLVDELNQEYQAELLKIKTNLNYSIEECNTRAAALLQQYQALIAENKDIWSTVVQFPVNIINEINTIYCTVSAITVDTETSTSRRYNLGTDSITLTTKEEFTYIASLSGGDVLYKYDGDGDAPNVADYDGPLSSKISNITPITYKIYKADGSELTEEEYKYVTNKWYVPVDSMIIPDTSLSKVREGDYYVIPNAEALNYNISSVYNNRKTNSTIIFEATYDNVPISATVTPLFMKEGESGTNGTKYAAIITCDDSGYGDLDENREERKLIGYYDTSWHLILPNKVIQTYAQMDVKIYKDGQFYVDTNNGQIIEEDLKNKVSVQWDMFDLGEMDPLFRFDKNAVGAPGELRTVEGRGWPEDTCYCQIIRAKITIANESGSLINNGEVIYAYYPLEIVKIASQDGGAIPIRNEEDTDNNYYALLNSIPTIREGFFQVLYSSAGINPKYDNANPFIVDNKIGSTALYNYEWSCSNSLTEVKADGAEGSNKFTATPTNRYTNSQNNNNYVKVKMTKKETPPQEEEQTERSKLLTQYKEETESNISYYRDNLDRVKGILDNLENLSYNKEGVKEEVEKTQTAFKNRKEALEYIDSAIQSLKLIIGDTENGINPVVIDTYELKDKVIIVEGVSFNNILEILNNARNAVIKGVNAVSALNCSLTTVSSDYTSLSSYYEGLSYIEDFAKDINNFNNILSTYSPIPYIDANANNWDTFINNYKNQFPQEETEVQNILTQASIKVLELRNSYSYTDYTTCYKELTEIFSPFVDGVIENKYNILLTSSNIAYEEIENKIFAYDKLQAYSNEIEVIRPILLLLNRYELTHLSDWDGNKLYIDENNDEYLFAPQLGAGIKNADDNTFTGMTMGVRNFNKKDVQHIGLFGYSRGIQTVFLNAEDGSAIFGEAGDSQITIDPNGITDGDNNEKKALLFSGSFYDEYASDGKPANYKTSNEKSVENISNWPHTDTVEKLLLTAKVTDDDIRKGINTKREKRKEILREYAKGMLIDLTTPEIRFANGNFKVNSQGHLTARGGGSIGGWQIGDDFLQGGNDLDGYTSLYSSNLHSGEADFADGNDEGTTSKREKPIRFNINDNFKVYEDGAISITEAEKKTKTAFSVDEYGNLFSRTGTIGGWVIKDDKLASTDKETTLWSNNVEKHTASFANKNTVSEKSKIERVNICNRFRLYSDGALSLIDEEENTNFSVDSNGHIYSQYGLIGRWTIDEDKLISRDKKTTLYATNDKKVNDTFVDPQNIVNGKTQKVSKEVRFDISGKFRVYSDGSISINNGQFSVDEQGNLLSNSGLIGSWVIKDDRLVSTNGMVTLLHDGTMFGGSRDIEEAMWVIGPDGYAKFSNIEINSEGESKMQDDGAGALFQWGDVKFWNDKAGESFKKNAGEIGGWWFDGNHFTSVRDPKSEEAKKEANEKKIEISVVELVGGIEGAIKGRGWELKGSGEIKFDDVNMTAIDIKVGSKTYKVLGKAM